MNKFGNWITNEAFDIIEIDIGPLNINRNNRSDLPYFDWNAFKKINRTKRCDFHDKSTILEKQESTSTNISPLS